jgi:tetratricopeptide (TPR) repeat protein
MGRYLRSGYANPNSGFFQIRLRQNRNAYFALDDFHQAIRDFTEAIRLDPSFALAYHYRGLAYQETGDQRRNKADQEKAVRLDPTIRES